MRSYMQTPSSSPRGGERKTFYGRASKIKGRKEGVLRGRAAERSNAGRNWKADARGWRLRRSETFRGRGAHSCSNEIGWSRKRLGKDEGRKTAVTPVVAV